MRGAAPARPNEYTHAEATGRGVSSVAKLPMHHRVVSLRAAVGAALFLIAGACTGADQPESAPVAPAGDAVAFSTNGQSSLGRILSPENGASFMQGTPVSFTVSSGINVLGGQVGTPTVWSSSRDGVIGTGNSIVSSALSVGEHTITVTVSTTSGGTSRSTAAIQIIANQAPSVAVLAPGNGAGFALGAPVTLVGSASDAEDGPLGDGRLEWSSDLDGPLGAGAELTATGLSAGSHVITLKATDSRGQSGTAQITIEVASLANQRPSVSISQPAPNATFAQGATISFVGSATDPEDGPLAGASLTWRSDRDGVLGTGSAISRTLSAGVHRITLDASDSRGAVFRAERTISVAAPLTSLNTVITAPGNGTTFTQGAPVSFAGSAEDPVAGPLGGAALVWTSSLDGQIGTGTAFSRSVLSLGTHVITLRARNASGSVESATVSITIAGASTGGGTGGTGGTGGGTTGGGANQRPFALMSLPAHRSTHAQGAAVVFTGTATDPEDGVLSGGSLTWRSDRDGVLGTGAAITRNSLSAGEHLVSLTATDAQGTSYTHYRIISVNAAAAAPVSVEVTLTSNTIPVGSVTSAFAVLRDQGGAPLVGRAVAWRSSNPTVATVSPTGAVTALAAGSTTISASTEGVVGSANLLVTSSAPPTNSGSAEPAGMTLITERAFNCVAPTQCEKDWDFVGGGFSVVQDPTAPVSPSNVGEMRYPAGFAGGYGPANAYRATDNVRTLYSSMWLKFSPNFQNHLTGINKVIHFYISGINRVFFQALGPDLVPAFGLQQIAAPYSPGGGAAATAVHLRPNLNAAAAMRRGAWHHIEIVLTANTPGVADGSVSMWLDGVQVLRYQGITFAAAGSNSAWEAFTWSPTWGGAGDVVASDMSIRMDHVYLSGKK